MKKWKKLIAGIVLCAFFFQAGPIYAFDLLAVDAPAAPITAEAEEESYSDEGELSLAAENAEPEEAETTSIPEEPNLPGIDLFEQSKNSVNSNLDINALQDGGVTVNNETEIDGELEDMREPSVKYFLNEDNSITASTYAHPVHYLDEETGRYRDIDNSLMASTDAELNNVLVNTDNAFRVKFARKAKENKLVKLDLSGYHISWGMEASNKDSELTLIEKEAEFLSANDPKELEDVTSAVVYPNIQENVDLRYDLIGTDLKENIILNTPSAPASFSFVYSTNELKMVQNEDGISLRTPQDEVLCFLKPLIMIDSDQAESTAIDVTLTTISDKSNNHQYRLTMTPSAQWLSSADRVYPVTIDPGISLGGDSSDSTYAITGTFVNEGAPTTVYTAPNYMWIGTNQPDRYAILIKSALPSAIKESDRVVNAQLVLTPYGSTFTDLETAGAPAIEAHEIKSSWESGSVTWNTKPSCDSRILDYDRAKTVNGVSPNNKYYTWDITQTVDKWFMENTCYGIMLKTPDNFMREYARASFWSSANTADKPSRPVIDITYINMVGLEDYWTYHSQNAGLAGNGYVNDFTGNLTTVFEDFTVPGERMPLTVNHSYSSYKCGEAQPTLNVGHGYRLNIQETVEKVTIGGATKYRYTDGDGTEHYFEKNSSGKWVDDSGLDLTLTVGTSEYTITDKKDNKRVFSVSKNYLLRIEDNDGNKITLNYDSNGWLLSVSDDSGKYAGATNRTITFERYSGTNLLQYMKYNGRTITYSYTDYNDGYGLKNCLTQVVFPGGSSLQGSSTGGSNVARFAYTTSGSLTDLIDATQNVGIHYEYSWVYGMRRIGAYSVCTYNGTTPTAKNRYTISYDQYHNTYTEVNPNEGRSENFYFNNMGQTVSAQDQDGNALYSEMGMSGGAKNKVTFASKAQQTITNLLKNHSFEGNFSSNYSTFGAAANISVVSSSSEYPSLFGNKLLKIQSTSAGETGVSQTVTVKGGQTYTFSAYFRTTFDAGFIRLSSSYGTAEETGIQQLNSYKRYDVTLDLTSVPSTQDVVLTASVGASRKIGKMFLWMDYNWKQGNVPTAIT